MNRAASRIRPRRPGIFRRRMILQLTSLLDLMLIIVFVQYLEMRQASAVALDRQVHHDSYLDFRRPDVYDVWQIHLNGNRSPYSDGSVTIAFGRQHFVFQPRDSRDFLAQLMGTMMFSPRP
ncbi:MAG TPA: hypothetical protein VMD30_04040, partial [Tepidisphaeraceae bacterium]|nr:hypothetical protein [Tepidisphaeraceae bacterium]